MAGEEKPSRFFKWGLASSGHRGRDDARGHRCHAPSGLTRTSGLCAAAPSRDGRAATPSAARGSEQRCAFPRIACRTPHIAAAQTGRWRKRDESADPSSGTQRICQAPQRRRRCGSSVTKRKAGVQTRSSRQARRPARAMAAGIVAASMARRCQNNLKNRDGFSPPANTPPAKGGGGL